MVSCRVSRLAQQPDVVNQRQRLEQFCTARGREVDEWLEEMGGFNFERKTCLAVVDGIVADEIGTLVLAQKDRLARFGFPLIEHLCRVQQCEFVIMNTQSLSPEQERTQDVLTMLHCFSSQLYGLRNYRNTVKEALAHDNNENQSPQDPSEPNA